MQRDAVHRRRHAVLADAVMDVAAGIVVGGRRGFCASAIGQVRVGEIGRAADAGPASAGSSASSAICDAFRVASLVSFSTSFASRRRSPAKTASGTLPAIARSKASRSRRCREPLFPGLAGASPRAPTSRQAARTVVRHLERRVRPAEFSRSSRRSRSPSGAPWRLVRAAGSGAP